MTQKSSTISFPRVRKWLFRSRVSFIPLHRYRKEPLEKYLQDAAAGTPTPGGGSVSAMAGALATTMASMSVNLTVGRPQFKESETLLKELAQRFERMREEFLGLMEKDMEAYEGVLRAYRLPKSEPGEKKRRSQAIQESLKWAMEVPLRLARLSLALLEDVNRMVDRINPSLAGDAAVAAVLAQAALTGGQINVKANLSGLKDEELVKKTRQEMDAMSGRSAIYLKEILQKVEKTFQKPV